MYNHNHWMDEDARRMDEQSLLYICAFQLETAMQHYIYNRIMCDHRRCASACVLMNVLPLEHNLSTYQILLRSLAWLACAITLMFFFSLSLSLAIDMCAHAYMN